ncbi:MAG: ATPase, T2SS/T4P/T4SS family [Anaerostipes sp.]|nr:ATPase, T2SS/T4P/T4SS family [Anaerostipes sp.]
MIEEIKSRIVERLDFSEDIEDKSLLWIIEDEIWEFSKTTYLSLKEKHNMCRSIFNSLRKLDVLQDLLDDDGITEIMINGYENIFVESNGKLSKYEKGFSSKEKLYQVIQQIVSSTNRMVNELNPIVDARLEDGSRVNVMLPPISLNGATMTIRKFAKEPMTMEWLYQKKAFSREVEQFLRMLVQSRYNIFISGGTGSGKTTLLNGLSNCIPKKERVITIEDSAELKLNGIENLVRLEMRNANMGGENKITIQQLIKASLRSRPDRIIVGEVRSEESLDMLQAMNTGHDGSISTGHANSTEDMIRRLETMVLMGSDMPIPAIRGQIASALDVMVHLGRLSDGSRKVLGISEVLGMKDGEVELNELWSLSDEKELEMTGMLRNEKKLKEYGMYEEYQSLLERIF